MDFINKDFYRLGRSELINAMPQIKHMTSMANHTIVVNHPTSFFSDPFFRAKKHHRIQIPLQCHTVSHAASGARKITCPIQPNGLRTAMSD